MRIKLTARFWLRFIGFVIFLILIVGVFSCSPARRMAMLQKNHPGLFKSDTVTMVVTEIIPAIRIDTMIKTDTMVIQKDRLTIKVFNYRDSVFVHGECAEDSAKQIKQVITNNLPIKEPLPPWVYWAIGIPSLLLVLIILALILRK